MDPYWYLEMQMSAVFFPFWNAPETRKYDVALVVLLQVKIKQSEH